MDIKDEGVQISLFVLAAEAVAIKNLDPEVWEKIIENTKTSGVQSLQMVGHILWREGFAGNTKSVVSQPSEDKANSINHAIA